MVRIDELEKVKSRLENESSQYKGFLKKMEEDFHTMFQFKLKLEQQLGVEMQHNSVLQEEMQYNFDRLQVLREEVGEHYLKTIETMKLYEIQKSEYFILKDQYEVKFRKLTHERDVANVKFKNELKLSASYKYRMVRAEERVQVLEYQNGNYLKDVQDLKQYVETQNIQVTSQMKEIIKMRDQKQEMLQQVVLEQLQKDQDNYELTLDDTIKAKELEHKN